MGTAHRRVARGSCSLSGGRHDADGAHAESRIAAASRRGARAWLLALLLAGFHASLLEGQSRRSPRGTKRRALPDLTCVVAKLADGDSFTCADGRKVRLLLIDTPEMAQAPWGQMAKRQLEALARPGKSLRLERDRTPTDRYGRTLAYAWADSVMINEAMVARGWAVVLAYENVRHLDRLQRAEQAARLAKRGFWQAWAFRCRPVDFRARRCGASPR